MPDQEFVLDEELLDEEIEDTVADPGSKEGMKKADASDKMSKDAPRFKEVYAKMKDFERKLEAKNNSDETNAALMEQMKEHNLTLTEQLKGIADKPTADAISDVPMNTASIMAEIDKAAEAEDFAKVVKLQAKMFNDYLSSNKPVDNTDAIVKKVTDALSDVQGNNEFEDWKKENPWYNTNKQAKIFSEGLAGEYLKEVKAGVINMGEMRAKVADETMKLFKIDAPKPTVSSVESGGSIDRPIKQGKVSWSAENEQMRQAFGVSKEDFAVQIAHSNERSAR